MHNEPSIFFHEVNERQGAFHRRAFLLGGLTGVGLLALTGRLTYLQLLQSGRYKTLSANNQFNYRIVPPPRGRILDRNGVLLAGNRPNFRLLVSRDEVEDPEVLLDKLNLLVPITDRKRRTVLRDLKQSARFVPVSVADDLTWEEFSAINVRAPELPGVTADMGEVRLYTFGGAFAHVIGYVAKVSADDVKKETPPGHDPDPVLLHPGFRIGKQGVEKAFDQELRGKAGAQKVEVDARGRVVRKDSEGDIEAVPGKEIVLSLDADIQNRALEVFGEESGAAVLMDCRTGDVLCLASAPSFDANKFVKGMASADYRALADYERNPLLDKALSGTYPPGSTFKMTTALALLAAGVDPKDRVVCTGGYFYGNRTFRCWKHGGHGSQDMHNAIKNSCDVYFYAMCNRAGPDKIAEVARTLGFGQTYETIKISGQRKGLVPDREYKRLNFKNDKKWHPGETLSYAIGQGYLNVNALQLAVMTSRLANPERRALVPRLIKSIGGEEQPRGDAAPVLSIPAEHIEIVRAGMAAVANDTSGTAYRNSQLGLGPIKMAGKTGTAQVRSYDKGGSRKSRDVTWKLRDHALFVAFAPYDDPRYALSVIVQHAPSGGNADAAPRAREIMRVALLKDPEVRKRIVQDPAAQDAPTSAPEDEGGEAPPPPVAGAVQTAAPAAPAAPPPGDPA